MAIASALRNGSSRNAGQEKDTEAGVSEIGTDFNGSAALKETSRGEAAETVEGVSKVDESAKTGKEWKDATQVIPENRLLIVFTG